MHGAVGEDVAEGEGADNPDFAAGGGEREFGREPVQGPDVVFHVLEIGFEFLRRDALVWTEWGEGGG